MTGTTSRTTGATAQPTSTTAQPTSTGTSTGATAAAAPSATTVLAGFASELPQLRLPGEVRERAKLLALDTLGVAIGGHRYIPSNRVLRRALHRLGAASGPASVIADRDSWTAPAAAMLNASLAHGMDFDDTHLIGLHPSTVLLPAATAAGQLVDADGATVLAGLVAGYEVMCRIGSTIIPAGHYTRGFHPTATVGVFGAAAAAGVALGLDAEGIECALGLAGSRAAGSSQFLLSGGWNKHFHVGAAAADGVLAAVLAAEGYQGARRALEGEHGFLRGYSDTGGDQASLSADLGVEWETLRIGIKPYPSCRYNHSTLDGLSELVADKRINPARIQRVRIGICAAGVRAVGEPAQLKRRPPDTVTAQFSLPFAAAVVLLTGQLRWDDYEAVGTPAVQQLCDKIDVVVSPAAEANYPGALSADIQIWTDEGHLSRFVETPSGEPQTFPSAASMQAKFFSLAVPVLGEQRAKELCERVLALDAEPSIAAVMELARPADVPTASGVSDRDVG